MIVHVEAAAAAAEATPAPVPASRSIPQELLAALEVLEGCMRTERETLRHVDAASLLSLRQRVRRVQRELGRQGRGAPTNIVTSQIKIRKGVSMRVRRHSNVHLPLDGGSSGQPASAPSSSPKEAFAADNSDDELEGGCIWEDAEEVLRLLPGRSVLGSAKRATPGLGFTFETLIPAMNIYDEVMPEDSLRRYRSFKVAKIVCMYLCAVVSCVLSVAMPSFAFFGTMRYTSTTALILAPNASLLPANSTFQPAVPWGAAWDSASLSLVAIYSVATSVVVLWYLYFYFKRSVMRLLWTHQKFRLVLTIGSTIVYGVAAISLMPNLHHVLWIIQRTLISLFSTQIDALAAFTILRFLPERAGEIMGYRDAAGRYRRGFISNALLYVFGMFAVVDLFRHWLVLFASKSTKLIDLKVKNLLNGNELSLTNHQLADTTYFTSMVLLIAVIVSFAKTHLGAEAVLLKSPYIFSQPRINLKRARAARR